MISEINFHNAHYTQSAPSIHQCPPETGAEIAFAGRSNAGKSSAINALTNNSKLARTSKTPGRTQLINFFALSDDLRLVDLPGYGYAKVPMAMKREWQQNLSEYLQKRASLRGLILLMDIRHPLQEFDTMMINWAIDVEMPVHILLTKSDKLKKGACKNTLMAVKKHLRESKVDDLISVQLFSALKKAGIQELGQKMQSWFTSTNLQTDSNTSISQPVTDK